MTLEEKLEKARELLMTYHYGFPVNALDFHKQVDRFLTETAMEQTNE